MRTSRLRLSHKRDGPALRRQAGYIVGHVTRQRAEGWLTPAHRGIDDRQPEGAAQEKHGTELAARFVEKAWKPIKRKRLPFFC
jgi:hypothetical protein